MEKEKNSETILVICIGLLIFYLIFHIKALLSISILIGLIGIFSDFLSSKIVWVWLKLAMILGTINGKILLTIIFFLVLTPISLFMKLIGKTPIRLKKTDEKSLFTNRDHTYSASDLETIW